MRFISVSDSRSRFDFCCRVFGRSRVAYQQVTTRNYIVFLVAGIIFVAAALLYFPRCLTSGRTTPAATARALALGELSRAQPATSTVGCLRSSITSPARRSVFDRKIQLITLTSSLPSRLPLACDCSRRCGNHHGLIRKYHMMLCRRCFGDFADKIGFNKVRYLRLQGMRHSLEHVLLSP